MIYLDNAATTKVHPDVAARVLDVMTEQFGNPGSVHAPGLEAAELVRKTRAYMAKQLHCAPSNIIFTACGSEANTMAIRSMAAFWGGRFRHAVTTKAEHESVLRYMKYLERHGWEVTYLDVAKDGTVTAQQVRDAIRPDTSFVSVMYANNELDGVNPVAEIGQVCCEEAVHFHVDAVQAAGLYDLNVEKLQCDFLSVSGHKFHAPKGVGLLYVREPVNVETQVFGGSEQEQGLRGGTENVPGIVGLGAAYSLAMSDPVARDGHFSRLKWKFHNTLQEAALQYGIADRVEFYSGWDEGSTQQKGKILSLLIRGVDSETLVLALSSQGVCVSSGSACNSHESEPSHVLLASGLSPELARNVIRVSFGSDNTVSDAELGAQIIARTAAALLQGGILNGGALEE